MDTEQITPPTTIEAPIPTEEPVHDVKAEEKSTETQETDGSSQADMSDSDEPMTSSPLMSLFSLLSMAKARTEAKTEPCATEDIVENKAETDGIRVSYSDTPLHMPSMLQNMSVIPDPVPSMPDQSQNMMSGLMSTLAPMLGSVAPQLMSAAANPEALTSMLTQMAAGFNPAMLSQMASSGQTSRACHSPSNCPSRYISISPPSADSSTGRQTEMAFEVIRQFACIFDQWLNKPKESTAHCVIEHRIRFVKE